MSLNNLSFFDANLRVPKSNRSAPFVPRIQDFPGLPVDSSSDNVIHVNQRCNFSSQPLTKYSHIAKKRRNSNPSSPGYDVQAHTGT